MSKPYWSGVFPAITTQLKRDQSLDLPATAKHANVLIESGVTGIVFLGSLGENQALSPEEKRTVIADGRDIVTIAVPERRRIGTGQQFSKR